MSDTDGAPLGDFLSMTASASSSSARGDAARPQKRPREAEREDRVRVFGSANAYDAELHAFPAAPFEHLRRPVTNAPPLPRVPPWTEVSNQRHGFRTRPTKACFLRLHQEILEFQDMMQETPEEAANAVHVLDLVDQARSAAFVGVKTSLRVFGSRLYGMNLPRADWDVVIVGHPNAQQALRQLDRVLRTQEEFDYVESIPSARVPLVKCRHAATGMEVDISFDHSSGGMSALAIRGFVKQFPEMVPLVLVLKYFLTQRGLNVTFEGGVGSFLLTCLVVHHLRMVRREVLETVSRGSSCKWKHRPKLQKGPPLIRGAPPDRIKMPQEDAALTGLAAGNLGYLLYTFLEYYGRRFNYSTDAIVFSSSWGVKSKASMRFYLHDKPKALAVESPGKQGAWVESGCCQTVSQ
jgi:DNA polymerase sigma